MDTRGDGRFFLKKIHGGDLSIGSKANESSLMIAIEFEPQFKDLFKKPKDPLVFRAQAGERSIKNLIEYFGIPHSEVGSIHVNGVEVCFAYKPQCGDWIYVRPLESPVDVTRPSILRPVIFRANHFVVDACVAGLAPKLRMLGCDVVADPSWTDQQLAEISIREQRILITRDRGLLMRKEVVWGRFIRGRNPLQQIQEVIWFFGLQKMDMALKRCLLCKDMSLL